MQLRIMTQPKQISKGFNKAGEYTIHAFKGDDGKDYSYFGAPWNQNFAQGDLLEAKTDTTQGKNGKVYNNVIEGYKVDSGSSYSPHSGNTGPTPQLTPPTAKAGVSGSDIMVSLSGLHAKIDRLLSTFLDSGVSHEKDEDNNIRF